MAFAIGETVRATTASGSVVELRVAGRVRRGHKFPVIDLATEDDWQRGKRLNRLPDYIPWPIDAVATTDGVPLDVAVREEFRRGRDV